MVLYSFLPFCLESLGCQHPPLVAQRTGLASCRQVSALVPLSLPSSLCLHRILTFVVRLSLFDARLWRRRPFPLWLPRAYCRAPGVTRHSWQVARLVLCPVPLGILCS